MRSRSTSASLIAILLAALAIVPLASAQSRTDDDWPAYGRDPGGARYSPLREITPQNVASLTVAWKFSTEERRPEYGTKRHTSFEATPLVVSGVMYFVTPLGRVFALDAATGRERWRYDAHVERGSQFGDWTSRGVSYWVDAAIEAGAPCRARIVFATIDARLITLDAASGTPCEQFGESGTVKLRLGLRTNPHYVEEYEVTSPPAIVRGTIVVGSAIADNWRTDAVSGEVRGYDAHTGALRWRFDPVPQNERDPAYDSWRGATAHHTGAANAWSVIAADSARGLVFVPTSSPSPDYYGGERLGDNRYANSLVALRAATGEVAWSFQTVHHDLWDYDNASPPALVTLRRDGRGVDAVLQATKTGMLYVLDRDTGAPIVPVEERAVPKSTVAGEIASPTQPFSAIVLSPHHLDPAQAFGIDSADRAACRAAMSSLRNEGIFTPPSLEGTLAIPSNIGGAHWGGVAFDSDRGIAIVPINTIAAAVQLIPRDAYRAIMDTMHSSGGWEYAEMRGTPYGMRRRLLLSPAGVPCTPPPFGSLVAVNLANNTIAWRVPLGRPGANATQPVGSPNLGGSIVTAGGIAFIAATLDHHIRAFDTMTGRELWQGDLPAGGKATPMTYAVAGRQYVAIAAGGDGDRFGSGDEIVVFRLPVVPR